MLFILTASGNLKNWKEEGNNMHRKHVFSEIHNENCFSTQRPTEALYLTVNKKLIKTQLQPIWPYSCFKKIGT